MFSCIFSKNRFVLRFQVSCYLIRKKMNFLLVLFSTKKNVKNQNKLYTQKIGNLSSTNGFENESVFHDIKRSYNNAAPDFDISPNNLRMWSFDSSRCRLYCGLTISFATASTFIGSLDLVCISTNDFRIW